MTLPNERLRAVNHAREFLCSLLTAPRIPTQIRIDARAVLKHYPSGYDMAVQASRDQEVFQEEPDDFKQEFREQARKLLELQEANRLTRSAALAARSHALAIQQEIRNTSIGK